MNLSDFDYHLPSERIAQTPIEPRHNARLMCLNRQTNQISHHTFTDIVAFLNPGDLLIANDSRVLPARLFARKTTGGKVEILLLKQRTGTQWEVLVGGKRVRPGVELTLERLPSTAESSETAMSATVLDDLGEARRLLEFDQPINALLPKIGQMPLPPYIHETLDDEERYQTIFSRVDGSAAAPTAGLHFTPEVMRALRDKGVGFDYVTLHVGLDTFKPVSVTQIEQHQIHREVATLSAATAQRINQTKLAGGRVVAVGTTSVRTLETAALRAAGHDSPLRGASQFEINQCGWQTVTAIEEETDLYIYPGYTFRAVDAMITNFHLPKSSLLMLVSGFAGTEFVKQAYQTAIDETYRFYSFGDAMLIV